MGNAMGGRPTTGRTDMTTNSSSTATGSNSNTYAPWVQDASQGLGTAATNAALGWTPAATTPLWNSTTQNAQGALDRVPGAYDNASSYLGMDRGAGYAQTALDRLLNFNQGDVGMSNWGLSGGPGGAGVGGPVRDAKWNDFTTFDINKYMNPYNQGVIDSTLSDIDRSSATAANDRAAAAAKAGAFGGSRHGVLDAVAAGETARAKGSVEAQLRDQAYKDAAARIGADQRGEFGASQTNTQADVAKRGQDINYATSMAGIGQSERSNAASLRLNALQSILSGGLNLGNLDLAHGGAWQNFGSDLFGRGSSIAGSERDFNRDSSFDRLRALGQGAGILGGLPLDRFGTYTATSTGTNHQFGTGTNQTGASGGDYASALVAIASLFGG